MVSTGHVCVLDGWMEKTGSERRCRARARGEQVEVRSPSWIPPIAINDFFIKTVTSAMKPLQAIRRPKDEEEWVIRNRAQVTKLLNHRRNEKRGG